MDLGAVNSVEGFDVVLIDGRCRVECAKSVLPYLKENAVVFIHDFWQKGRERYLKVFDYYNELKSIKDTEQTIVALKAK